MLTTIAAMALSAAAAQKQAPPPAPAPAQHKTAQPAQQTESITCPLTGEQLPCPNCCPLKK